MAAEICPESTPVSGDLNVDEVNKDLSTDAALCTDANEKVDCGTTASAEGTADDNTDSCTKVAPDTETEAAVEATADTTDETATTGTKRKCEDEKSTDECDDLKKVKTDEAVDACEADTKCNGTATENNGCHAEEATNGKSHNIPEEIVTKTVEDVMNPCEDVAASS